MLAIIFLCLCSSVVIGSEDGPHVKISDGTLRGSFMRSKTGRQINAFQGIPFAEPPIGELRFKSPVPVKPWAGVLDATKPHTMCPQPFVQMASVIGDENCLFLNVYTPKLPPNNDDLLPVMLYMYGGGFEVGTGSSEWYGPKLLLDKDVILVTINYRLGALGFLSTGDDISPGNYGLKDQSFALQWVVKNINYFGGDPKKITLFGHSAGGASTNYHLFSPLSKGLFKGVISQSGFALNNWAFDPVGENVRNSKKLAENLNCPTSSSIEMIDCLRKVEPRKIIELAKIFQEWDKDPVVPFKPVAEAPSSTAFLLDSPINLLKAGKFEDVPLMVGLTEQEGIIRAGGIDKALFQDLSEDFNNKVVLTLLLRADNIDHVGEQIKKFYFGDKKELNKENAMTDLINMYSDGMFTNGLADTARIHLKVSKHPIYNYLYAHKSTMSLIKTKYSEYLGVCHADELFYLFPMADILYPKRIETDDDEVVTKLMTTLWTNFARTGNPTPEIDDLIKTKWEPIKSERLEYYHIDAKVQEMKDALFEKRVEFWRTLSWTNENVTKKIEL